jgi:two-component system, LytTR family, sensor kinase
MRIRVPFRRDGERGTSDEGRATEDEGDVERVLPWPACAAALDASRAVADPAVMGIRRRQLLVIVGVATALSIMSSALSFTFAFGSSKDYLARAIFLNTTYWVAWAVLAPGILALAGRFRFERGTWRQALAVHVPAMLAACFAHVSLSVGARLAAGYGRAGWSFWMSVRDTFLTQVDWEMMTYFAIVGVSQAVHYQRAAMQRQVQSARLETSLAEARLQALQRQLHPHFLFNTLHGISALMHRDVEAADRMIALLADLLRASLNVRAQEIPLKDELELLRRYLDIERVRFGERLTIHYDIDPETLDARLPSLVLQPLAENAIEHGIAPMSGPGRIDISARREGRMLWIEVHDDGLGLGDGAFEALRKGIGVSNTESRLRHLYGPRYRFEFVRRGSRGLTVRVVVPWQVQVVVPASQGGAVETVT